MKIAYESYHISYELDGKQINLELTEDGNIEAYFHKPMGHKPKVTIDIGDRLKAVSLMSGAMESAIKGVAYDLQKMENDEQ